MKLNLLTHTSIVFVNLALFDVPLCSFSKYVTFTFFYTKYLFTNLHIEIAYAYNLVNRKNIDQLNFQRKKRAMIRNSFGIFRKYCSDASVDMIKVLNVAEKNDAAKTIANVMSRGSARKVLFKIFFRPGHIFCVICINVLYVSYMSYDFVIHVQYGSYGGLFLHLLCKDKLRQHAS